MGYLVEEISNQPLMNFYNEKYFEPLEMDNAFLVLSEIIILIKLHYLIK